MLPRPEVHTFWRYPNESNLPTAYLPWPERSRCVGDLLLRYVEPTCSVLEIGCNVGRNLAHLYAEGFRSLAAIEISPAAVAELRHQHPQLAEVEIYNAPVEDVIGTLPARSYDAVFSLAVLAHLHADSDGVFAEMARVADRLIVTVEDETGSGLLHEPRDYGRVFGELGWREVSTASCEDVEGLSGDFIARAFLR